jgi:hypothetical protein
LEYFFSNINAVHVRNRMTTIQVSDQDLTASSGLPIVCKSKIDSTAESCRLVSGPSKAARSGGAILPISRAVLRSLGLQDPFISGYLFTEQPPAAEQKSKPLKEMYTRRPTVLTEDQSNLIDTEQRSLNMTKSSGS